MTKSGERIPCEYHIALSGAPGDEESEGHEDDVRGTVGVVREITERVERERTLEALHDATRQMTSAETPEGVCRVVADACERILGYPITVVRLLDDARETGDLTYLDPIGRAADRVNRLTTDLLTLARQGRTMDGVEKLRLASLVDDAWAVVGRESVRLTVDERLSAASAAWGTVEGDPARVGQLLENLLANAIEHGGRGVEIEVGPLSEVEGFYVADDGPGIRPTKREHVFDHDYTTSPNGIGLGLAIVETVAEAHGWRVTVTESETGGARFEVRTG